VIETGGVVNRGPAGRGEREKNAAEGARGTHWLTHRGSPPSGDAGEARAQPLVYLAETATTGSEADRRRAVNPWVVLFRQKQSCLPTKRGFKPPLRHGDERKLLILHAIQL